MSPLHSGSSDFVIPGTLGIDFGTSNSAVSWAQGSDSAQLIALEGEATTLPTALFFDAETHTTHVGREALAMYLAGHDGRLMRSLKSLLGSPLLLERTSVNHQLVSFQDIIGLFLAELVARARAHLGGLPRRLVLGRPVHFVDDDPQKDALAQTMLLQAAEKLGFEDIAFQLEPIAAALDYERRLQQDRTVLVVDIGGGTSDFTVVRLGPQRRQKADRQSDILATTGVHIGGTDYDKQLSLAKLMPLLGYKHTGPDGREVPSRPFIDLSTWHLIHWQQSPKAIREAQTLRVNFSEAQRHDRLMKVLREQLGHGLAHTVEQAKIACSNGATLQNMDLSLVEAGLSAQMGVHDLAAHLQSLLAQVVACAQDCVREAELKPSQIDAVYLTGGSSALAPFQQALREAFAQADVVTGDLFGGVASGLAYSL
jgi:hypothetical chaperone protein